jgi:hypothetical protein
MKVSKQCSLFAQCDAYVHMDNVCTSWKTEDHMASPGYEAADSFDSNVIDIKWNIQTCLLLWFYAPFKFWKGWHKKYVGLFDICWFRIGILSRCSVFESASMPINTMTKFPTLWNLKHSYYGLESHSGHRHKHALYFIVFSRAARGHWTAQSEIQVPPKLLKLAVSRTGADNQTWSVKFEVRHPRCLLNHNVENESKKTVTNTTIFYLYS